MFSFFKRKRLPTDAVFAITEELEPVPTVEVDGDRNGFEDLRQEIARLGRMQMKATTVAEANLRAVIEAVEASQKERIEGHLVKELLSVVDGLDESITQGTLMVEAGRMPAEWVEGIVMVRERVIRLLNHYEITTIEVIGKVFDPTLCTAVGVERTTEVEENTVVTEQRKGYRLGDKVIRYAEVIVAKKG